MIRELSQIFLRQKFTSIYESFTDICTDPRFKRKEKFLMNKNTAYFRISQCMSD